MTMKTTCLMMKPEVLSDLKEVAAHDGISMAKLIRQVLEDYLMFRLYDEGEG